MTSQPQIATAKQAAIEDAFAAIDAHLADLDGELRALGSIVAKGAKTSRNGKVRDLMKRAGEIAELAAAVNSHSARISEGVDRINTATVDARAVLRDTAWLCEQERFDAVSFDGYQLFSFPVRLTAQGRTLKLFAKSFDVLRPSAILSVLRLRRLEAEKHREDFLELAFRAYEIAIALNKQEIGAPVLLDDLYRVITLHPTSRENYPESAFLADVYWHDSNGELRTRNGYTLSFPASTAASGGRGQRFVTRGGAEKVYTYARFLPTADGA